MGYDTRFDQELAAQGARDALIEDLSEGYRLDIEVVCRLLAEAERAASQDPTGRSLIDWFQLLAGLAPEVRVAPGKCPRLWPGDSAQGMRRRGSGALTPGKRTLTMLLARDPASRARAGTPLREIEARSGERPPLAPVLRAPMSPLFGVDLSARRTLPDDLEAPQHASTPTELVDVAASVVNALVGRPPPGWSRMTGPGESAALAALLADRGIACAPAELAALTDSYGRSIGLGRWLFASGMSSFGRMREHAASHGAADLPPFSAPLEPTARDAVQAATGVDLSGVVERVDPQLDRRGLAGEAHGGQVLLAPSVASGPAGYQVRIHEAVHVAQARQTGPVAERSAVEREAAHVADAAARGERAAPRLRADTGDRYGFDLPFSLDPMDLLREHMPDVAGFIDEGFEGILKRLGDGAGDLLKTFLDGIGVGKFVDAYQAIADAVKPGSLGFGILTGCCECLNSALDKMHGSLERFLAGESAGKVQKAIADAQANEKGGMLDALTDVFALLKKVGGPILSVIEGVAGRIEWAKKKFGFVADKVWQKVAGMLGLDASLPPLAAIKKKLQELWQKATSVLAPLGNAIRGAIEWLKNSSPLAQLLRLTEDVKALIAAIKKLAQAKTRGGKAWLAELARELKGTVFEPLLQGLLVGQQTLAQLGNVVGQWFQVVLLKLGMLQAWNSGVAFVQSIISTVHGFVGKVMEGLREVGKKVGDVVADLAKAASELYAGVKPLLDFVVGLVIALGLTMSGQIWALPAFLAGQLWLRVLPDCYKTALLDFFLKAVISVVEWLPANGMPIYGVVKHGTLSFLRTLQSAPDEKKIRGMDLIASLFAGNVEFAAGLVVGVFKGIYESTIGTVVFVFEAATWLVDVGVRVVEFAGKSIDEIIDAGGFDGLVDEGGEEGGGGPGDPFGGGAGADARSDDREDAAPGGPQRGEEGEGEEDSEGAEPGATENTDDVTDEDAEEDAPVEVDEVEEPADDTPQEDEEPSGGGDEEGPFEGPEEEPDVAGDPAGASAGASDAGADNADNRFDPPPALPQGLLDGRALFDKIFKEGVTRAELEQLLNTVGTGLENSAAVAGQQAAQGLIRALNSQGAAYAIGEVVGTILGIAVTEIVIAYFTGGLGLGKTAVTLTKLTLKLGKDLPRLLKLVRSLADAVRPLLRALQGLKKGIGQWAAKLAKYIDDLIEWARKSAEKLLRRLRNRSKPPRTSDRPDVGPRRPKPFDKKKRDENLRLAAMRGAQRGWQEASARLGGRVHSLAAVRSTVGGITIPRARGVQVKLAVTGAGSSWRIKATARKKLRSKTWKSGDGWITRDEQRARWYATISNARLHADVIADSIAALQREAPRNGAGAGTVKEQYEAKKREAENQQREGQNRIESRLHGIRYTIDMEPLERVEDDLAISTTLLITPNTKRQKAQIPLALAEYLGARRVGTSRTFEGTFSHPDWNWNGYPDGGVTRHPVNESLAFRQDGTSPRPPDTNRYRSGGQTASLPVAFQGPLDRWRTENEERREFIKESLLAADPSMTRLEADRRAMNQICDEFAAKGWPRHAFDELQVRRHTLWQAHHIQEASWDGSDDARNLQYLPLAEHNQFTQWWEGRRRDIEDHLGLNK